MKNINLQAAALVAVLMGTSAPAAFAAGTEAGTVVSNSIDVSYVSGGETITVTNASTATFTVDRRIDLSVESQDAGNIVTAAAGANDQVLSFLLTNEGNAASGYDITVSSSGTLGLTYDPAGTGADGTYYTVFSTDDVFDAGDTIVDLTGATNEIDLAADGAVYMFVVTKIVATTPDGLTDNFLVSATAMNAGTNVVTVATPTIDMALNVEDVVFSDPGNDGVESDNADLVITAPQLTFTKSVIVVQENINGPAAAACGTAAIDPNAAAAIPGSCLEYTITVTNDVTATSPASTLAISDALPAESTYAAHQNDGFTTLTFDAGTGVKGTMNGSLTSLAAGETASFTVRVTID